MSIGDALGVAAAAALSTVGTALALVYGRVRGLLDAPGRRRSHRLPTPRGGGVGIVLAVLGIALLPAAFAGSPVAAGLALATGMVALVGWWDDHRALPPWPRLVVHLLAATVLTVSALGAPVDGLAAISCVLVALLVVGSINLHNFIDGIDGLLVSQSAVMLTLLAVLCGASGERELAGWCAVAAAACLGFLPWNLPPARIFLGDVGSGALGVLVAGLALLAWQAGVTDVGGLLMVVSAIWVDGAATLLLRVLRGRRWWLAHREHLYQWLVRSGWSHGQVTALYLAWTAVLVPVLLWLRESTIGGSWAQAHPTLAQSLYLVGWPLATLAAALWVWWAGKTACLRRVGHRKSRCVSPA